MYALFSVVDVSSTILVMHWNDLDVHLFSRVSSGTLWYFSKIFSGTSLHPMPHLCASKCSWFYMQFTHPHHLLHINYIKWELRYLVWIDKNKHAHIIQGLVGQFSRSCKPQREMTPTKGWRKSGTLNPWPWPQVHMRIQKHVNEAWLPMGLQNTCSCCTYDNFWWSNIIAPADNQYRYICDRLLYIVLATITRLFLDQLGAQGIDKARPCGPTTTPESASPSTSML